MAIRILWDKYETALLIEACLQVEDGILRRNEAISSLLKVLRKRAVDAGVEIDDVFRNENGISMQFGNVERLLKNKPDARKHNTRIFIDMVDMYFNDRTQFDLILQEAKGAQPVDANQDRFFAWLSKNVPSFPMSDYFCAVNDLETFARKKRIFNGSLFDITDAAVTGRIVSAVSGDRFFRFTHKKQIKNITDIAEYFHKYTKEIASEQREEAETTASVADSAIPRGQNRTISENSQSYQALNIMPGSSDAVEVRESETEAADSSKQYIQLDEPVTAVQNDDTENINGVEEISKNEDADAINAPEIEETDDSEAQEKPPASVMEDVDESGGLLVDFEGDSDFAFTTPVSVTYFGETSYESSWRKVYIKICKILLEDYPDDFSDLCKTPGNSVYNLIFDDASVKRLAAPAAIGSGFCVETNRSASNLMRNVKLLLDFCRVDYENLEIRYEKTQGNETAAASESTIVKKTSTAEPKSTLSVEGNKDPVLAYLEANKLEYLDYRNKLGCLWIIGGRELTDKMQVLYHNGVRMHFRAGGGNATEGRDAWWTKDYASKPISTEAEKTTVSTNTTGNREKSQSGRSKFIKWMVNNNTSSNSARTAAWALTKASNLAMEQKITTEPLYTICDGEEMARIAAKIEDNYAFQQYRKQNTVVLFALRKYVAFRSEEDNGLESALQNKDTEENVATYAASDDAKETRTQFTEYMLGKKYSPSTARGVASDVSSVSDYANEHGFTSISLFSITDYRELEDLWSKLSGDSAFKKYNISQNRRFTVAMKRYLAFRQGERGISRIKTAATDRKIKQSAAVSGDSAYHPGRIEFEEWLRENNVSSGSIKTYADGVQRIGIYLTENGLEDRNIFAIRGITRLEGIRTRLIDDKAYAAQVGNSTLNLDCYALKRYIGFRKNDSSDDINEGVKNRFSAILRDDFENGFRINSMIDRNRFKQFYTDAYGEDLSLGDDELVITLGKVGSEQDGRIFIRDGAGQNDCIDDIHAEIARVFGEGISCVYFSELFSAYQDILATELQIYSADVLKEILLHSAYGAYRSAKYYFYLMDRQPDAQADITRLLQRSSIPLNYDEIYRKLSFIPLDTIKHTLVVTDKMVNVAQETYFYAPNLPVNTNELQQISDLIHGQLQQKSFITDAELRELIERHCPSVAINTESFTTYGLRNVLSVLLGEQFSFNGPIISEFGEEINMAQAFAEFCKAHETMSLDELKDYAKEMNTIIYWDAVYEEMIRISQNEFVRKDQINFDVPATDAVLDELISGDYQVLQNFTLFLHFPTISVRWNSFVLESYAANYSRDFSLMHASYTATDCCGAIVRKDSHIIDFKGVVTDVLAHSRGWNNKNDALVLLVNKGYLQRKRYADIDTIIPEVKLLREQYMVAKR